MLLSHRTSIRTARPLLAAALCVLLGAGALLRAPTASAADDWQFRGTIYGWLPGMDATTNLPTSQGSIQVDGGDILDALQFAAMGTLEARKGRWGVFTDLIYTDLSDSKTGARPFTVGGGLVTIPGNAILSANMSMKAWVWTLAGEYAAIQEPTHDLNVFAGFRYLKVSVDFAWAFAGNIGPIPLALRQGGASVSEDYWDAIVGVHGAVRPGVGNWFLPYYLDIGTGSSTFTWQALAGVGYQFKWGDVVAAYRYLDYNQSSGQPIEDLSMYGPLLGVTFRF